MFRQKRKSWHKDVGRTTLMQYRKIENFIRTKYELKRWVMDGPMPDPSTLGNDDDTVSDGLLS